MCAFSNLTNPRRLVLGPENKSPRVVLAHPLSEPHRLPYFFSDRRVGAREVPDDGPLPPQMKTEMKTKMKSRIRDKDDGLKRVPQSLPIFDVSPARLGKLMQTSTRRPKWETSARSLLQRKRKFVKEDYNTKMVKMFENLRDLRFELQLLKTSLETIQTEEGEVSILDSDKEVVERRSSGIRGDTMAFMKREFVGFRRLLPTSDNQPKSDKKLIRRSKILPTAPMKTRSGLPGRVSLPDI